MFPGRTEYDYFNRGTMEGFVLNLFSDQLSKILLDFHRRDVDANFLSGKGSIRNIKLNVDLLNDYLNKPPHGTVPFLEFTEITLSELRVEVTSYTNLKKAPIVLVIEEIHAEAREPLDYHVDPAKNARYQSQLAAARRRSDPSQGGKGAAPKPYGLVHRILDNLSLRIGRIHLSFASLGKLKTRRRGPWTPPALRVRLDDVEWICVTETGSAGTPEEVWAHNERSFQRSGDRGRHRSCTIYKRLSMACHVELVPWGLGAGAPTPNAFRNGTSLKRTESASSLLSNTKIDIYLAYVRRLRDAAVTGADVDVLVHSVDINLDVASYDKKSPSGDASTGCDLGAFVHMMVGLLHCYYKDRSFVDPFLPEGATNNNDELLRGFHSQQDTEKEEEIEAGPDDILPEVAMVEDDLESSEDDEDYEEDKGEEHDDAYLAWKRGQEKEGGGTEVGEEDSKASAATPKKEDGAAAPPAKPKSYKAKRKAVIVIASGAQKFERLSFSLSVPRVNMKLCFPNEDGDGGERAPSDENFHHCLELLLEGLVAE